jgi:IS5 family transposase
VQERQSPLQTRDNLDRKGSQQLEARKDKLQDLNELVPWAVLRQVLEQLPRKERKSNAGRKAIDPMILFKLLLLKHLYNLSNEEVEYQAHDRSASQLCNEQ